jgi:hypothetical protein
MLVWMLALIIMFFALTAAPSSNVKVRATNDETHITYYTDATYATKCGYTIILCSGYRGHNGCTTAYSTESYVPCLCEVEPC